MKSKALNIVLLAALFAGCQNDPSVELAPASKITIQATPVVDTKIGFEESDNAISLTWDSADGFSVYNAEGAYVGDFKYSGVEGEKSGTFAQVGTFEMPAGDYTAVIPAVSHATLSDRDAENTTATQEVADLESLNHLNGAVKMRSEFTYGAQGTEKITFAHELSLLKVNVTMPAGVVAASIAMTDGDDSYSLTLPSGVTESSVSTFMAVEETEATVARDIEFTVVDTNGVEYATIKTTDKSFAAGSFYSVGLNFASSDMLNLVVDLKDEVSPVMVGNNTLQCGDQIFKFSRVDAGMHWAPFIDSSIHYDDGLTSLRIFVAADDHWSWIDNGYTLGQSMLALYSAAAESNQVSVPEEITDGDERYIHFSTAFRKSIPVNGTSVLMRAVQSQTAGATDENLPIVELGWNEEGKFGAWTRSGAASSSAEVNFVEVDCPFELSHDTNDALDKWYDVVVAYKFSPSSDNGFLKVYIKQKEHTAYHQYVKEGIKVGYSDAPATLETLELGYRGGAHPAVSQIYLTNIAYRDYQSNIPLLDTNIHPEIFVNGNFDKNNFMVSGDAIVIDDVQHYFHLVNLASWAVGHSSYMSRYHLADGTPTESIKVIVKESGYWGWKTTPGIWGASKGGTMMCALYSEKYSATLPTWPEYINDGEERYINASIGIRPNSSTSATDPMIANGPAVLLSASQTKAKGATAASLPVVEMGWNEDSKFGFWARSGSTGAADDATVETHFFEVEAPFVNAQWSDFVLAYKYSPDTTDGWVKLYVKSWTEDYTEFKEYKLENIQVGYSDAPNSFDTVEFGYSGVAHEKPYDVNYNCVGYTDYWVDDYFPTKK